MNLLRESLTDRLPPGWQSKDIMGFEPNHHRISYFIVVPERVYNSFNRALSNYLNTPEVTFVGQAYQWNPKLGGLQHAGKIANGIVFYFRTFKINGEHTISIEPFAQFPGSYQYSQGDPYGPDEDQDENMEHSPGPNHTLHMRVWKQLQPAYDIVKEYL